MKKLLTLFAAFTLVSIFAFGQTGPKMDIAETTHNFGKIPQGIPVKHQFVVKNTGDEPLLINNVQKVCGCTVTEWTKKPIMPGETGTVTAQYNAARMGRFKKPITVLSNATNSPMKLYFEGEVVSKDALEGAPENKSMMNNQ